MNEGQSAHVWKEEVYRGLSVVWTEELDGGGRDFGQDFIPIVATNFGRVGRLFEFCCGPSFIGFSLLANELCDTLVLADINPLAITAVKKTIERNHLENQVTVYKSDGLTQIPASERWDLVVSNPPHYPESGTTPNDLLSDDPGWKIHRDFYANVGDFLAPGASVLFQESTEGSSTADFSPMLSAGGLWHVDTFSFGDGVARPIYYYIWSKKSLDGFVSHRMSSKYKRTVDLFSSCQHQAFEGRRRYQICLKNCTDRTILPRPVGSNDRRLLYRQLPQIPPFAQITLPELFLTRTFRIDDAFSGVTMAVIKIQ